jgi:multidrug efflux pump subunit AcrA (membrane-fusion protein)
MRRVILIAATVFIVVVGGFFVYQYFTPAPPPELPPEVADAPALTVSAEGVIIPAATTALGFTTGGRVSEVLVRRGDPVGRGAVLARLEDAALAGEIKQAERAADVAAAQLAQLQAGATPAERSAAQARLDAALQNYARVRAGPTREELAARKTQIDNALALLKQAQAGYDRIGGASNPDIGLMPQAAQLEQATNNYNAALAALEDAQKHPTASELAAAWAEVENARSVLDRLNPGV